MAKIAWGVKYPVAPRPGFNCSVPQSASAAPWALHGNESLGYLYQITHKLWLDDGEEAGHVAGADFGFEGFQGGML
jgi:hypothetical protein